MASLLSYPQLRETSSHNFTLFLIWTRRASAIWPISVRLFPYYNHNILVCIKLQASAHTPIYKILVLLCNYLHIWVYSVTFLVLHGSFRNLPASCHLFSQGSCDSFCFYPRACSIRADCVCSWYTQM